MTRRLATIAVGVALAAMVTAAGGADKADRSVFEMPRVHAQYARLQPVIASLIRQGKFADAERRCREAIELIPTSVNCYYNLACVQARQGKTDEALRSLEQSIQLGFNQTQHLQNDGDLESLRDRDEFRQLVEQSRTATPAQLQQRIRPESIADGKVLVSERNTAYDPTRGLLMSFFASPQRSDRSDRSTAVVNGHGNVGSLLRKWYAEGSAAGNYGDLYDNHDGGHSSLDYASFPQITRIQYDEDVQKQGLHKGIQTHFFFNGVTIGNVSMAATVGPYWRSLARLGYVDPRGGQIFAAQYQNNHLYVYVEHRDHDVGRNGQGGGYGDTFPANTPYIIVSQGSSGSDRPFLDAVACTLAAFRPDVKKLLTSKRAIMPTVQMIFRISSSSVRKPSDYLTGKAHPTVFESSDLDVQKMVELAHSMQADNLPPLVKLKVVEEDEAVAGRDYFDVRPNEKILDTPSAIARVALSTKRTRRMVISAEASFDLNERPLTWKWSVLRGNRQSIKINPVSDDYSKVELLIPAHRRSRIEPSSSLMSNRVDVGAFVFNGKYYSAPGFISIYYLDNELRVYRPDGQVRSVEYSDPASGGNYIDPLVATAKDWRDEYRYDDHNNLIGWTRIRGQQLDYFTADGALITRRDDQRRALEARSVRYLQQPRDGKIPLLTYQLGDEILSYEYDSPHDKLGKVKQRTTLSTAN